MPQTSEQAGQVFAQMTPEQVQQYLSQKLVNIGPLQPVDAPMGSADGVRREDMTPTYGNANVQGLQADGQGGYWGPVTPPFDTQQAGGKYGQYFAKFDVHIVRSSFGVHNSGIIRHIRKPAARFDHHVFKISAHRQDRQGSPKYHEKYCRGQE